MLLKKKTEKSSYRIRVGWLDYTITIMCRGFTAWAKSLYGTMFLFLYGEKRSNRRFRFHRHPGWFMLVLFNYPGDFNLPHFLCVSFKETRKPWTFLSLLLSEGFCFPSCVSQWIFKKQLLILMAVTFLISDSSFVLLKSPHQFFCLPPSKMFVISI